MHHDLYSILALKKISIVIINITLNSFWKRIYMFEIDERLRKIIAYYLLFNGIMLILSSFEFGLAILKYTNYLPVIREILGFLSMPILQIIYSSAYLQKSNVIDAIVIVALVLIPYYIIDKRKKSKELEEFENKLDRMEKSGEMNRLSNNEVAKLEEQLARLDDRSKRHEIKIIVVIILLATIGLWIAIYMLPEPWRDLFIGYNVKIRPALFVIPVFFGFYYIFLSIRSLRQNK